MISQHIRVGDIGKETMLRLDSVPKDQTEQASNKKSHGEDDDDRWEDNGLDQSASWA